MLRPTARGALATIALGAALLAAGCGRGAATDITSSTPASPARVAPEGDGDGAVAPPATDLGFPTVATKNTTRVAASDPVAIAAAVARSVFPGLTPETRPDAVALVDRRDWRAALAASVLMSDPIGAPLLLSDGGPDLPAASQTALDGLNPTGSAAAGGAGVIRIGDVPRPDGRRTTDIAGRDPFVIAQALDAFQAAANGRTSDRVMIVSADDPAFAAPAAAYAAKSGDPILFARRDELPEATRAALRTHQQPSIYVVGPPRAIGAKVTAALREFGTVTRIEGADPVRNAITFAAFSASGFGWGVVDPGHGLVFAREDADPATAAAAAPLSASGTYGPLLLLSDPGTIDPPVDAYLKAIQPGYRLDPVRGVYNHGWLVGDTRAMTPTLQARVDTLLEIMRETTTPAEAP